jgi:hypothetical protein
MQFLTRSRVTLLTSTLLLSSAVLAATLSLSSSSVRAAADPDNTLTPAEKKEGFVLLFDGKTLDGWHVYHKKEAITGWKIANDAITRAGEDGDLITDKEYGDFELRIDWKISPKGNSGILYRGSETEEHFYFTAPEYQVLDNEGHPDGKNGPTRWAGANYALIAPSQTVVKPVGEWNSARIIARGAHVEHWLNGVKIVEYELWSPEWKALVAGSKFKQWPSYGMSKSGHIGLQDHGADVAFKNIKIKVLQ